MREVGEAGVTHVNVVGVADAQGDVDCAQLKGFVVEVDVDGVGSADVAEGAGRGRR